MQVWPAVLRKGPAGSPPEPRAAGRRAAERGAARRSGTAAGLLVGLLALATGPGCKVGPDHAAPDMPLPERFATVAPAGDGSASAPLELERWWEAFSDPALDELVTVVLSENRELQAAQSRLREARALRAFAAGGLWPSLDLTGDGRRARRSENAFPGGGAPVGQTTNLFTLSFDALWELDFFGGQRRAIEAAEADLEAAGERLRDVRVSLAAEAVRNALEARTAQRLLDIAADNIGLQSETVRLVRNRREAGLATELDVQSAEAQLATTRALVPALQIERAAADHALSVLRGRPVGPEAGSYPPLAPAAGTPPDLPQAIPAELLRRRPDIRAAERVLAAASARIGVATAELYPQLSLAGSYGVQAQQQNELLTKRSDFWNAGLGLRLPIFNAGRLSAQVAAADARVAEALADWESAVLAAMAETADALVAVDRQRARRDELAAAVAAQERAIELAQRLYESGLVDFLDVLDVQRRLLVAQEALAASDRELGRSFVALCKALGGGWSPDEPLLPEDAATEEEPVGA